MAPSHRGRLDPEQIADHLEPPELDARAVRGAMGTLARLGWFRRARGGHFELDGAAVIE